MSKHRHRKRRVPSRAVFPKPHRGAPPDKGPLDDVAASASPAGASAVRFLVLFVTSVLVYFLLTSTIRSRGVEPLDGHPIAARLAAVTEGAQTYVLRPYQRFIASSSATMLSVLGYVAHADDRTIRSDRFSVTITDGCDAVEVSLLLVAAILTFPARIRWKLAGLGLGLPAIALLNLLRVLTLWLIGVHWHPAFAFAHFSVWPFVFICSVLAVFLAWLRVVSMPSALKTETTAAAAAA